MTKLATTKAKVLPAAGEVTAKTVPARRRGDKAPNAIPADPETAIETAHQPIRSTIGTVIDPRSLLFDTDWYQSTYPDVAAAGLDPIRHFFDNGAREGRNPNPHFETSWYVSANADVAASMMNPFLHYLLYGAREGRKSRP